jgi:inner membrane protein involved in colicin E2 resistance
MSTFASPIQPSFHFPSRSMGAKFFVVMLLAFVMSISGFFVYGLTKSRADNHGLAAAVDNGSQQPKTVLGIKLVDSYRSTIRSVHYITLFLGLVFLTYFLFEVKTGKRVHLAQYAMVGVAQTIFYLLLLSLAEHLGFDLSFLIAGGSTVVLFASNTEWVFRSRKLALRALAVFTAVYAFIYVLLRVEAYALLVGAVVSFAAIAAAMYMTRNVDWYAGGDSARSVGSVAGGQGSVRESWLK